MGRTYFPINRPFVEHVSGEVQSRQPASATERKLSQCFPAAFGRIWTKMPQELGNREKTMSSENKDKLKCIAIDNVGEKTRDGN